MRFAVRGDGMLERIATRAGVVPVPAFESLAGMAVSGVLIAAVRLGIPAALSRRPATAARLAEDLKLDPQSTELLLDALCALGYAVRRRGGVYGPTRGLRRWLDPSSGESVTRFISGHGDNWSWWAGLPQVIRSGVGYDHHSAEPGDPYWTDYITGQYELARFSAPEVARVLRLPAGARRVLDVGGGHGWFAAELCRRHAGMRATVVDLPGSVAVGRDIITRAGLDNLVEHRVGDALVDDLGEDFDVALCFNLIHHLQPEQIVTLLTRIHRALRPGGRIAVLDLFSSPSRAGWRCDAAGSFLNLYFHLTSSSGVYTAGQLQEWLDAAGFGSARRIRVRRIPTQALFQATKRA